MDIKKHELQKIALKLFNKGILNTTDVDFSPYMALAKWKEVVTCTSYIDEVGRIGKDEYKKKYLIR